MIFYLAIYYIKYFILLNIFNFIAIKYISFIKKNLSYYAYLIMSISHIIKNIILFY